VKLGDVEEGLTELRHLASVEAVASRRRNRAGKLLACVNGLLGLLILYRWRVILRDNPAAGIERAYLRLVAWGRRLGQPPAPADTPREFATDLTGFVSRRNRGTYPPSSRATEAIAIAERDVPRLIESLERSMYSREEGPPAGLSENAAGDEQRWIPLWRSLRYLWFREMFGVRGRDLGEEPSDEQ
jgi:hypothetical protein